MQHPRQANIFLSLLRHQFAALTGIICLMTAPLSSAQAETTSSMTMNDSYREIIRNDPDFGPTVVPIITSTLNASLSTNVPWTAFTKKTAWSISIGFLQISGHLSNDLSYVSGGRSVTLPFIDPDTHQPAGTIFMTWADNKFVLRLSAASDLASALFLYAGSTQVISDTSDVTIQVGHFTNTTTLFLTGTNVTHFDNTTGLQTDKGTIIGLGDFTPPTVSIATPAPMYTSRNPVFNVTGSAADNLSIGAVVWRWAALTDNPSTPAARFSDWNYVDTLNIPAAHQNLASWKTSVDMSGNREGTNIIWVASQDATGRYSQIQTRTFFYAVPSQISLFATDGGTAVGTPPVADGANLIVERSYTVTAQPTPGNIFLNWTDGDGRVVSVSATYNFLMQDSLSLQANFGPNPFPAAKGTYLGLFAPSTGVSELDSGSILVTVGNHGGYSGVIKTESASYPFVGKFVFYGTSSDPNAADGSFESRIPKEHAIIGDLHMNGAGPGALDDAIGGRLSIYDARLQRRVIANIDARHVLLNTGGFASAGQYNFQLPSSQGTSQVGPLGCGYGSLTFKPGGAVSIVATVADNTASVSCATAITKGGGIPMFATLYDGKGIIGGWLNFTNDVQSDIFGNEIHWIKRRSRDAFYPDGFNRTMQVTGSRYIPPAAGESVFGWTTGTLSFADFSFSGTQEIAYNPALNVFSYPNGNADHFHLKLVRATGNFSGTFTTLGLPVSGVVLPKSSSACGFFINHNQTGYVLITPQ